MTRHLFYTSWLVLFHVGCDESTTRSMQDVRLKLYNRMKIGIVVLMLLYKPTH